MSDKNVSKNSNTSSPGVQQSQNREPAAPGPQTDRASPDPGGNKIHGDKMRQDPGQQNQQNKGQNPGRVNAPQNQKR
jgi:hypothetical protein